MLGKPAKATVWLIVYNHRTDVGIAQHRGLFLTSDPTGAGLYEVVRQSVPHDCRTELVLVTVERRGDASGVVALAAEEAVN